MDLNGLKQCSLADGFDKSYFSAMKKSNREKVNKIFGFDENMIVSISKYKEYVCDLKNQLEDIYYVFDNRKELKSFIVSNSLYSTVGAFEKSIFSIFDNELSIQYKKIKKWEKIIKKFREY